MLITDFLESIITSSTESEERFIVSGIKWSEYDKLLQQIGDRAGYRVAFLDEVLEIMSPSENHELIKENIGRLLEAYLQVKEIDFWGVGSTTFRNI